MCGIIGYVGYREAWPIVLAGLQRLEYRGYDSTGVVTLEPHSPPEFHRSVGKVSDLVSSLNGKSPKGTLGLGHTRWATHGRPTLANAHPHTDCQGQVALVHNGIVENFLELKNDLLSKGHTFTSETDSEVIAHMIEEELAKDEEFEKAFSQATSRIKGANAVVAIWQGEPDKILALRLGNAGGIAIAQKDGETVLASDLPALVSFSNEVTFLEAPTILTPGVSLYPRSPRLYLRSGSPSGRTVTGTSCSRRSWSSPGPWAAPCEAGWTSKAAESFWRTSLSRRVKSKSFRG